MTATENWKIQWSYKTPSGDLVNIRANTAEELSILLEGVSMVAPQAAATSAGIQAAYNVAPLSTGASTSAPMPPVTSPTAPTSVASSGPTCVHGARKFLSGVSKKNGKPYAMWVCTQPQDQGQCSPVNG